MLKNTEIEKHRYQKSRNLEIEKLRNTKIAKMQSRKIKKIQRKERSI